MAVAEQITRIQTAKENIKTSLSAKGVDVGDAKIDEYSTFIDEMQVGGDSFGNTISKGSNYGSGVNKIIKEITNDLVLDGTDASYLFYNCESLINSPNVNITGATNATSMYNGCASMLSIPEDLDTGNITNGTNMFYGCTILPRLPENLDFSKLTNASYFCHYCKGLLSFPQYNFSNVTNVGHLFYYCEKLETVALLDFGKVTNVSDVCFQAKSLANLEGFKDLGKAFDASKSANYSYYNFDLSTCNKLTHESLMNVINNLYDIASKGCNAQQLKLGSTNLAKLTEEEIAIATNKGWTVS